MLPSRACCHGLLCLALRLPRHALLVQLGQQTVGWWHRAWVLRCACTASACVLLLPCIGAMPFAWDSGAANAAHLVDAAGMRHNAAPRLLFVAGQVDCIVSIRLSPPFARWWCFICKAAGLRPDESAMVDSLGWLQRAPKVHSIALLGVAAGACTLSQAHCALLTGGGEINNVCALHCRKEAPPARSVLCTPIQAAASCSWALQGVAGLRD